MTPGNPDPVIFSAVDWRVLDALKVRNLSALKGITDDINKQIIRELSDGITSGEGMPELSKRIQDSVSMGKRRADTVARTETINASVEGARIRYEQAGLTEFKYIAASDSRVCERCAACDGKTYKLTDNAHLPPLHPNCRCAIAPVVPKSKTRSTSQNRVGRSAPRRPTTPAAKTKPDGDTQPPKKAAFMARTDLTAGEKDAILHYRDIGDPQHTWKCPIPAGEKHEDCYVIQKTLRSDAFRNSLIPSDLAKSATEILLLDTAVAKSRFHKNAALYKGLRDPSWILNKKPGESFDDLGFGSFSLDVGVSLAGYTPRDAESPVFLRKIVSSGDTALYIGGAENEVLFGRGKNYKILAIEKYNPGEFLPDSKAIVYYIQEAI